MRIKKRINYFLLIVLLFFSYTSFANAAIANDINYEITSFNLTKEGKMSIEGWSFVDHADNYGGKNLTTWIIAYRGTWNKKWAKKSNCNKAKDKKGNRLCYAIDTTASKINGHVQDMYYLRCVGGACNPTTRSKFLKRVKNGETYHGSTCMKAVTGAANSHCIYYNVGFKAETVSMKTLSSTLGSNKKIKFMIVSQIKIKHPNKTIRRYTRMGFLPSDCKIKSNSCKNNKWYDVYTEKTTKSDGTEIKSTYKAKFNGLNNKIEFTAMSARGFTSETVRGNSSSQRTTEFNYRKNHNVYYVRKRGTIRKYYNYKGNGKGEFYARRIKISKNKSSGGSWAWTAWLINPGSFSIQLTPDSTPPSTTTDDPCDEYCIGGLCDATKCTHEEPEKLANPVNNDDSHSECTDATLSTNKDGTTAKVQVDSNQYYYRMNVTVADKYFKLKDNSLDFLDEDEVEEEIPDDDLEISDIDYESDDGVEADNSGDVEEVEDDEDIGDSGVTDIYDDDDDETSTGDGVSTAGGNIIKDGDYYYFPITLYALIDVEQTGQFSIVKGGGNAGSGYKFSNGSLVVPAGGYFNYAFDYTVRAKWSNGSFKANGNTGTSPNNTYVGTIEVPIKNSNGSSINAAVSLKKDSDYLYKKNGSSFTGVMYNLDLYKTIAQEKMNSILQNNMSDNVSVNVVFDNSNNYKSLEKETRAGTLKRDSSTSLPSNGVWAPNSNIQLKYHYEINQAYAKVNGNDYSYYSYAPEKVNDSNYVASLNKAVYYIPTNMNTGDKFKFTVESDSLSLWDDVIFSYNASCYVTAVNTLKPPPSGNGSSNLSYRTIDVNDPFPSTVNRIASNWSRNLTANKLRINNTFNDMNKYYYKTKKMTDRIDASTSYSSFNDVLSSGNSTYIRDNYFGYITRNRTKTHCEIGRYNSSICDLVN